jgi:hypothetical protein
VDRTACAWLIARFIDPDAEFVFVGDPDEVPENATPFDIRGIELGHRGGECSFEAVLRRYQLDDPVLWAIARIVHEADLEDERYRFVVPASRHSRVCLRRVRWCRLSRARPARGIGWSRTGVCHRRSRSRLEGGDD